MKLKFFLIGILVASVSLFSDELADVDADIATTTSVDQLAQKMTQANHQYKYRYMNAIKNQIAASKAEDRAAKLENMLIQIQSQKAEQLGTLQRSMSRSGSLAGHGGTSSDGGHGGSGGSGGGGSGGGGSGGGGSGGGGRN
ncbi:MAG: hypothetical protein IBX44_02220 [Sulfurospirillum sp.]|nr:hypothetical protein [Sulfurospirillum sp.]